MDASNDGKPRPLRYKGNAPSEQGNTRNPENPGSWRGDLKDWVGVLFAGWPTPTTGRAHESENTAGRYYPTKKQKDLEWAAWLAGPGEMQSGYGGAMKSSGQLNPALSRWLMGLPKSWDDCVPTETRLSSRSRKSS